MSPSRFVDKERGGRGGRSRGGSAEGSGGLELIETSVDCKLQLRRGTPKKLSCRIQQIRI